MTPRQGLLFFLIGRCRGFVGHAHRRHIMDEKTTTLKATENQWDVGLYQKHSFVFEYGESLVDILDPQPGETILDVGCGSGQLTQQIAEAGAVAIGVDYSKEMVAHCKEAFPELLFVQSDVSDVTTKEIGGQVDAIFSNAALHWVTNAEAAVIAMSTVLRPGGRFVAELGGKGNVEQIVSAANKVTGGKTTNPWYFPSISEYSSLLEAHGMEVTGATLFDRPTKLQDGEQGMYHWLSMFGDTLLADVPTEEKSKVMDEIVANLKQESTLFDGSDWNADYRRLRIVANKVCNGS